MKRLVLFAASAWLAACSAWADPGYYVLVPYDREGIVSAELRYWTAEPKGGSKTDWPEVGIGYGVNSRWTTLLLSSYTRYAGEPTQMGELSWQNEILLTQGEQPFDLALHLALIRDRSDTPGNAYQLGSVLQTEIGPTQFNGNLVFERWRRDGAWSAVKLKYQWQVRQHGFPWLQPGLQGFGELGAWDHWAVHDKQSHRAGPALFATLPPGGQRAVQLQAALLFGSTYGRNGRMLSARLLLPF